MAQQLHVPFLFLSGPRKLSWQYGQLIILHDIGEMSRCEDPISEKHEWEPSSLKAVPTGDTFVEASTLEAGEVKKSIKYSKRL